MKVPILLAKQLIQLSKGEVIPSYKMKHNLIDELVSEGIIESNGRIQKALRVIDPNSLFQFLQNKYGINDLENYVKIIQKENLKRSELVQVSSDSKLKQVRTFKGFLINSYFPIQGILNNKPISLNFTDGIFKFIYDFENFVPEQDLTIVGIENSENFRFIQKQRDLFKDIDPLFVSRYPQNQSKDLIKWLQSIPNSYIHFGDFDFAGIGIYLNEFKIKLGSKATFFVPENIENLINEYGNKNRYTSQNTNLELSRIDEQKLLMLISLIHKYRKGLDQEIFIQ